MSERRRRATAGPRPAVEQLRAHPSCEVLIVGGGINGVGVFRDLALQGVDVTLIDRGDIAGATSAASSRMIHGGLRYLENGEFRLVREAVAERNDLLATAPHHVRPLLTTIPLRTLWTGLAVAPWRFVTGRGPRSHRARGAVLVEIGLQIYDAFSHAGRAADGTGVPRHRLAGRERTHAELPRLGGDIRCSATYTDAGVRAPERLAMEVALDALAAGPHARMATYVEAIGMDDAGVALRDVLTGEILTVAPEVVVNAAGPWGDLASATLGAPTAHLGGTKGSHLVLDHPELLAACAGREIFFENTDGRIVLVYPQRGRVIVGTTDIPADPREPVRCTEAEVDYFLELIAEVFPDIEAGRADIVFRYAGIRPLPRAPEGAAPGRIPRDYRLVDVDLPGGVPGVSVVGGKWTTFRALGEAAADRVLAILDRPRRASTRGRAIGGGRGFPVDDARDDWIAQHLPGVPTARAEALLDRYGTRCAVPASLDPMPLAAAPDYTRGEIRWIARAERVERLADVVLRRTTLAFDGRVAPALLEELADLLGDELGWTRRRRRDEVAHVVAVLADAHGVYLEATGGYRFRGEILGKRP